ncbi:hypothetical protein SS39_03050 [Enterobacter chengduensis]|nr:hypothetical protein SS50_16085 [Enterobacter chengduensis]KJM06856.1 hypothetical protein SS39_03050 [Enterobacter chengduensis]
MKKLLELRQQKAALKTQMRSMLDKADGEKRSLNEEEGKKFDELRAQADALEVEITRLEAVADDQRNLPGTSVEGEPVDAPRDKCAPFREINGIAAAFQYSQKNYNPTASSFL